MAGGRNNEKGSIMRKIASIVFLILAVYLPPALSAEEYSLDDLYRLALERSETVKIAEEDLYISERSKDKAMSALLPTLSAFGNHTRYSEEKLGGTFLLQPEQTNEWGLRLDQSFSLSGRELTAFRISKEGISRGTADLHAIKEQYLLSVAEQYYDLLRARKGADIAKANVERLTKHRDASRKRLEVGEVTKTAVLRAEAELAAAQSDLIRADNILSLAKINLAMTAGITGTYDVKEPLPGTESQFPEGGDVRFDFLPEACRQDVPQCLEDTAMKERAEITALSIEKKIAEDEVTFAKGSYWPNISVEGVYLRQENDPESTFGLNERIYGTLKLNFPFFEGGLRVAEVEEARARLRQAELRLAELKRAVSVEVQNSYLSTLTESSVVVNRQKETAYASDNYRLVSKQFQYGLADSIDVIDANTLLVTSERELSSAEYAFQLALLRVKRAAGIFLKEIIAATHE